MRNEIYLRRKLKVFIPTGTSRMFKSNCLPDQYIATMMRNIENLGFTFSKDLVNALRTLSIDQAKTFYVNIAANLKKMVGANVRHKPMYPNFPQQVMEMVEAELYINAIFHYLTFGEWIPEYEVKERFPSLETHKPKGIGLGTEKEFVEIGQNLINSKTSLSETDKTDVMWYVEYYKNDLERLLPDAIPLKENVALVSKCVLENIQVDDAAITFLKPYFKTATDVLRLATSMSDGDISLATNTNYRNFNRSERKLLLGLLEHACGLLEEDMKRYTMKWIRLGEKLHPGDYKGRFEKAYSAFWNLRNNHRKIKTFNGKVETALSQGETRVAADLLKQRPGEFARRLDHLMRMTARPGNIIARFAAVASKVSVPVLLQVMAHFRGRNSLEHNTRVFFPKRTIAKAFSMDNHLPEIDDDICQRVVTVCDKALCTIFKERGSLGNVHIDERLASYLVPFSQRSASGAFRTITRGSQVDMPENMKTLRSFIHWKNISASNRVDIDSSAVLYDDDWNYKEHISYTRIRSNAYKACHSGDITNAPNGASEFIDIDIESARRYGVRYIVWSVLSYSGQPFCKVPECFMGWMSREEPGSGEIYEPKTVENKIDLTANTRICIPMIIDLKNNKVIWTDLALKKRPSWSGNNVESNQRGMIAMGKAMSNFICVKPTLFDLFNLHVEARGELVSIEEADTIFTVVDDVNSLPLKEGARVVTHFDDDVIMGEFL